MQCSWVVVNEQLMPYEFFFEYDNDEVDIPTIKPGFVKEFASILDANGLRNHIGPRLIRDKETKVLEVTEGLANVTFPLSEKASARLREQGIPTIEAGWRYPITDISNGDMETRKMIVQNSCTIICRQIDKGHIKVHLGGSGAVSTRLKIPLKTWLMLFRMESWTSKRPSEAQMMPLKILSLHVQLVPCYKFDKLSHLLLGLVFVNYGLLLSSWYKNFILSFIQLVICSSHSYFCLSRL